MIMKHKEWKQIETASLALINWENNLLQYVRIVKSYVEEASAEVSMHNQLALAWPVLVQSSNASCVSTNTSLVL